MKFLWLHMKIYDQKFWNLFNGILIHQNPVNLLSEFLVPCFVDFDNTEFHVEFKIFF